MNIAFSIRARHRVHRPARALCCVAFVLAWWLPAGTSRGDALARMNVNWLKGTRESVELLAKDRKPVALKSGYTDYRAIMHCHSRLSHDSRGTPDEIRAAAKKVGVRVILFTEHPSDKHDFFTDGNRGLTDDVLFIPGAEIQGLLAYPTQTMKGIPADTPQDKVNLVLKNDGQVFLCHLEERMDWDLDNLTGSEIYNIHADFKDEPAFVRALMNPAKLFPMIPLFQQYPQEAFAALMDYPTDYLKRYDELCMKSRLTGVAANDSHHNQGLRAVINAEGKLRLEDGLGKQLAVIDPNSIIFLKPLVAGKKEGDMIFQVELDPYERSFHHVSTHLLMHELSETAVRETLKAGRAYVAFDWIGDPTGFVFQAVRGEAVSPMGSEVTMADGIVLRAAAPLQGTFRLIRNGHEIASKRSDTFEQSVTEPGNYRVEVWLNLHDGPKVWILSNPIYVRAAGSP